MPDVTRELLVTNRLGLHLRAAARIVHVTNQFKSQVLIHSNGVVVNAKSIMGILILAAACGSEVIVKAKGPDAKEALDSIEDLIERRFDEEE